MLKSKLGISAVSTSVIDVALDYAERERVPLMIVASRNQVEDASIGAGYTTFTSSELAHYVHSNAPNYGIVCRDHGGPYFSADDAGLAAEEAHDRAVASLRCDIDAGFDLLHVDWSKTFGDVAKETVAVVGELRALAGDAVCFEVGADETDGGVDDVAEFENTLATWRDCPAPLQFVVGRTGTHVLERFQVGHFDFDAVRSLTSAAHRAGFRFKEHNADYLSFDEITLRPAAGVDAVNIGPELGVLETTTVARLALTNGAGAELEQFFRRCLDSGRWRKWMYGNAATDTMKSVVSGHYCQSSPEYQELLAVLKDRVDVEEEVRSALRARIDCYVTGLEARGDDA
jgi:hypothetical protein